MFDSGTLKPLLVQLVDRWVQKVVHHQDLLWPGPIPDPAASLLVLGFGVLLPSSLPNLALCYWQC